ncbi:unnamed protein product [Rhizoctonia solani]|uniref:Uncharacterized protein n=1 Tax=Rhizoctonia solani TaxID=456999 RepID=A0A8H3E4D6_9AGAM|nr:unnamed protein product [Rhizoctonia solani]
MSRPPQDSPRRAFSSSNYVARSMPKAAGRLRIDFKDPVFNGFRDRWGRRIYFWSLEYRKSRALPYHESILLKDLTDNPYANPHRDRSQVPPGSGAGRAVGNSLRRLSEALPGGFIHTSIAMEEGLRSSAQAGPPDWASNIPEDINDTGYLLKFERFNPETQPNPTQPDSAHRAEACDCVNLKTPGELNEQERNSTVELAITFPRAIPLEEVFKICLSISKDETAQKYTARQYNCYFFAWSIISMLVRSQMHYDWVRILRSNRRETTELINRRLVELSNPQRLHGQGSKSDTDVEILPNLTLFLCGECNIAEALPDTQRPFIREFATKLVDLSTFESIASSLLDRRDQPLWARDQLPLVRDKVRELLENVADSTVGLATAGTGESNAVALFWSDTSIPLDPEWDTIVGAERNKLLDLFSRRIWSAFREALEQTRQAERPVPNQTDQARSTPTNLLSLIQRIGDSPTVLAPQLTQLGLRAAWNAAGITAETRLSDPQNQPFQRTIRTLRHTPRQIGNVGHIMGPFIDVLSARREQVRASGGRRQPGEENPLSLDISNVLSMMGNINLQPQEEDRIVLELERSVKNMAAAGQGPDFSVEKLRRASLELMLRLKKRAREIDFGLNPDRAWRVCVWYSLSEEIIRLLYSGSQAPNQGIQCWLRAPGDAPRTTSGDKRFMSGSAIHEFIHGRIERLSKMIHNQRGPGAPQECQVEIEEAMTKIWQGLVSEEGIVTR